MNQLEPQTVPICRGQGGVPPGGCGRSPHLSKPASAEFEASPPLVSIQGLGRDFRQSGRLWGGQSVVRAVRDVTLEIRKGETLGVVGESGCGKSTLGRMAIGMLEPTAGDVTFGGRPLYDRQAHQDYKKFRRFLAGRIQMIFQDPYSSLNPRMRIGDSVAEPLLCAPSARAGGKEAVRDRVAGILAQVGMEPDAARRYPHEFSGGQRQRVAIARALVTRPDFVVCDEPTSSLDASVQSQVLNLLQDMQEDLCLTYMFISHDLAVVRHMSDRVAVMYRGLLVEEGDAEDLFAAPLHPYTRLLLDSVPRQGASLQTVPVGEQKPAVREESPGGCPFAPRCPEVMERCALLLPDLAPREGRQVRCFLYG